MPEDAPEDTSEMDSTGLRLNLKAKSLLSFSKFMRDQYTDPSQNT